MSALAFDSSGPARLGGARRANQDLAEGVERDPADRSSTPTRTRILAMALSPDGNTLAAASDGGGLQLSISAIPRHRPRALDSDRRISAVAFSRDGRLVVAGTQDGRILMPGTSRRRRVNQ